MEQISNNKVNIPTLEKDNDIDIAQSVRNLMRRDGIRQREINILDKAQMSMNRRFNEMRILIKLLAIGLLVSDITIIAVYIIK